VSGDEKSGDSKGSPSDVERMLAGIGLRDFRYREFASTNKAAAAMAWPLLRAGVQGPNAPAPPPPKHDQTLGARIMAAGEPPPAAARGVRTGTPITPPAERDREAPPPAPPARSTAVFPGEQRPPAQPPLLRRPLQQIFARLAEREPNAAQPGPGGVKSVFKRLG
jgi:hypothetical protein